jgi:hypothetical protein
MRREESESSSSSGTTDRRHRLADVTVSIRMAYVRHRPTRTFSLFACLFQYVSP